MKYIRTGSEGDLLRIIPENEKEQRDLEEAIGWKNPNTLNEIICKLIGYRVEDDE